MAGTQGRDIVANVSPNSGEDFDKAMTTGYVPTDASHARFGKTVLRFADAYNQVTHGAVYYGSSRDGTPYVYTKCGWPIKPEVMKLSDLKLKVPEYGNVKGIRPGESGYYTR